MDSVWLVDDSTSLFPPSSPITSHTEAVFPRGTNHSCHSNEGLAGCGVVWKRHPYVFLLTKIASLLTNCYMLATCKTCQQKGIPHGFPEFVMLTRMMLAGARRQCSMPSDYQCSEALPLCPWCADLRLRGQGQVAAVFSVPTCICKNRLPEKVLLRMVLPGPESSMVLSTWVGGTHKHSPLAS